MQRVNYEITKNFKPKNNVIYVISPKSQSDLGKYFASFSKKHKLNLEIISNLPLKVKIPNYISHMSLASCNLLSLTIDEKSSLISLELPANGPEKYNIENAKKLRSLRCQNSNIRAIPYLEWLEYLNGNGSMISSISFLPRIKTIFINSTPITKLPKLLTIVELSICDTKIINLPKYPALEFLCAFGLPKLSIHSRNFKVFMGECIPEIENTNHLQELFAKQENVHYLNAPESYLSTDLEPKKICLNELR